MNMSKSLECIDEEDHPAAERSNSSGKSKDSTDFLWTSGRTAPSQLYQKNVMNTDLDPRLLWQSPIPVYIEKVDAFGTFLFVWH